jgi:hypothetical protein
MRSGPFTIIALICALLVSACHKDMVPPLKDAARLRAEALKLMELPQGDVPKTQWPGSVKDLKPLSVTRESDNIKILLAHERGKFSVGYHIYPDDQHRPSTRGVWIEKTGVEGIYIYKTQY